MSRLESLHRELWPHLVASLARRFGGRLALDSGEITSRFELPPPNQFSLALEALEDGTGAFNSILSGNAILGRLPTPSPQRLAA